MCMLDHLYSQTRPKKNQQKWTHSFFWHLPLLKKFLKIFFWTRDTLLNSLQKKKKLTHYSSWPAVVCQAMQVLRFRLLSVALDARLPQPQPNVHALEEQHQLLPPLVLHLRRHRLLLATRDSWPCAANCSCGNKAGQRRACFARGRWQRVVWPVVFVADGRENCGTNKCIFLS